MFADFLHSSTYIIVWWNNWEKMCVYHGPEILGGLPPAYHNVFLMRWSISLCVILVTLGGFRCNLSLRLNFSVLLVRIGLGYSSADLRKVLFMYKTDYHRESYCQWGCFFFLVLASVTFLSIKSIKTWKNWNVGQSR